MRLRLRRQHAGRTGTGEHIVAAMVPSVLPLIARRDAKVWRSVCQPVPIEFGFDDCRPESPSIEVPLIHWRRGRFRRASVFVAMIVLIADNAFTAPPNKPGDSASPATQNGLGTARKPAVRCVAGL